MKMTKGETGPATTGSGVDLYKPAGGVALMDPASDRVAPDHGAVEHAAALNLTETDIWDAQHSKSISPRDLGRRSDIAPLSIVEDSVALPPDADMLAFFSDEELAAAGQPRIFGVTGRYCDTMVPIYDHEGRRTSMEVLSLIKLSRADGEYWRQAKVMEAVARNEPSPYDDMTTAIVVMMHDPTAPSPMHETVGRDGLTETRPEHAGRGDYRVVGVMDNKSALFTDEYAHYPWADSGSKDAEGPTDHLLSRKIAKTRDLPTLLRPYAKNRRYHDILNTYIETMGKAYQSVVDGDRTWDEAFDHIYSHRVAKRGRLNRVVHQLVKNVVNYSQSPLEYDATIRAYWAILAQKQWEKSVPRRNRSRNAKELLANERNRIFAGVLGSIAMGDEIKELTDKAAELKDSNGRPIPFKPVRAVIKGVDPLTRDFAKSLASLKSNKYRNFGTLGRQISDQFTNTPPDTQLMIMPTSNDVAITFGLKDQVFGQGIFIYHGDSMMPVSAPHGANDREIAEGNYLRDRPLVSKGWITRASIMGAGMAGPRNLLFGDLWQMQGSAAQLLDAPEHGKLSHFNRPDIGLVSQPTRQQLLRGAPNHTPEQWALIAQTPEGVRVRKVINQGDSQVLIRQVDGNVRLAAGEVDTLVNVAKQTGYMGYGEGVKRDDIEASDGQFAVRDPELFEGEHVLARFTLKGLMHIEEVDDGTPDKPIMKVAPSRPNRPLRNPHDRS